MDPHRERDKTPRGEGTDVQTDSGQYLFDRWRNVKILLGCFFLSLLILLLIEPFVHKHPYFRWEEWPEFYAVFGFVACVALVLAAKYLLRPLVKRDEDYYG